MESSYSGKAFVRAVIIATVIAGTLDILSAFVYAIMANGTPLGIDPNHDGGGLFVAACINLAAAILMLTVFRRREFGAFVARVAAIFAPVRS